MSIWYSKRDIILLSLDLKPQCQLHLRKIPTCSKLLVPVKFPSKLTRKPKTRLRFHWWDPIKKFNFPNCSKMISTSSKTPMESPISLRRWKSQLAKLEAPATTLVLVTIMGFTRELEVAQELLTASMMTSSTSLTSRRWPSGASRSTRRDTLTWNPITKARSTLYYKS